MPENFDQPFCTFPEILADWATNVNCESLTGKILNKKGGY
jgi:hypothetical protein